MSKMTLFGRFRLGLGKLRRVYLHTFHRDYIRRNLARRRGECARCGACCKLMFRCPYLDDSDKLSACTRHHMRWWNCKIFPVDERDLQDRDLVNDERACGYRFHPSLPPQRWLAVLLAVGLGLASVAGSARAAATSSSVGPAVVQSSFRGERLPGGWWVDNGRWECARGGLLCTDAGQISGALSEHAQPVKNVDATIEVWGTFTGRTSPQGSAALPSAPKAGEDTISDPALSVIWGEFEAGLERPLLSTVFATFGDTRDTVRREGPETARLTKFHFVVELEQTVARARTAHDQEVVTRDLFGGSLLTSVKRVAIRAAQGTVIHAVRIEMTPRTNERNQLIALADEAHTSGNTSLAMDQYARIEGERGALLPLRAEATYKRAALLWDTGKKREAVRVWGLARTLDRTGPWGERACLALGRAALEDGRPATAFSFAGDVINNNAPQIEEWEALQSLLAESVKGMEEAGVASQTSFGLERIAERLQWSRAPSRYAAWAWRLVAASYEHRGYADQAVVAQKMAKRLSQ